MVGGKVVKIENTPHDAVVRLTVEDGKDRCRVQVMQDHIVIKVGDSVWWQAGHVYWTPQGYTKEDHPLVKIGYSSSIES